MTINQSYGQTSGVLPPGAPLVIPHGLNLNGGPLPQDSMFVILSAMSPDNPTNPLWLTNVDDTTIEILNTGINPQSFHIEFGYWFPHFHLTDDLYPDDANYQEDELTLLPGDSFTQPNALRDHGELDQSLAFICVPVPNVSGWLWVELPPTATGDPTFHLPAAAPGPQLAFFISTNFYSIQRVLPGTDPTGRNVLLSWDGPHTLAPGAGVDSAHGLLVDGAPAVPDIAYPMIVGGPAEGAPTTEAAFITRPLKTDTLVRWENHGFDPITIYSLCLRMHSAGRVT